MKKLLCVDKERRCSAKEALSHPWFGSSLISLPNLSFKETPQTPQLRPGFFMIGKNENLSLNTEAKADTERLYKYNKISRKYSPSAKNTNGFLSECKKSPRKSRYFGSMNEQKVLEFDGVK